MAEAGAGGLLPPTLRWEGGALQGCLFLIDQTRLPSELVELKCQDVQSVWEAIRALRVRGAPAIGVAAAYGAVLGARSGLTGGLPGVRLALAQTCAYLRASRPTAVNLFWALDRVQSRAGSLPESDAAGFLDALLSEARLIEQEDRRTCETLALRGAELIQDGQGVLTHCNAGSLATSYYGTALGVLYAAFQQGKRFRVYADETRPLLQGARLTAWELQRFGIPVTLICDNMAALVMREKRVGAVLVGADRIAANGDTANKIGTYGLAVLAQAHGIPLYIAAPSSTFDLTLPDGLRIPIENRDSSEITHPLGQKAAPDGIDVYNPAFDVTPAHLITAIISEKGVIRPVSEERLRATLLGA